MNTIDAETGQVVQDNSTPATSNRTIPSMINIPPQLSTTLVWVGLGVALGIWIMWPRRRGNSDT